MIDNKACIAAIAPRIRNSKKVDCKNILILDIKFYIQKRKC